MAPALARAVKRGFPGYRLPLPKEEDPQLRDLCREAHPELRVTYAARGDFNGDGRADAVLHLLRPNSRDAGIVAAFHGTAGGRFEAHEVDRWQRWGRQYCLSRVSPDRLAPMLRQAGVAGKSGRAGRRPDGIDLSVPDAGSRTYFWDGRRYRHLTAGDG
jgi:hypothetical protein